MKENLILLLAILNIFAVIFIIKKLSIMSEQLTQLQQDVADEVTVEESAIVLLGGLKTALDAAIASQPTDDGAALAALSTTLETEKGKLAAAITANTPAASAE